MESCPTLAWFNLGLCSTWLSLAFALSPLLPLQSRGESAAAPTNSPSVLIEAAGRVEWSSQSSSNWQRAVIGVQLRPGDYLRTHVQSRAAVQLSDRSVIRVNERTTLEILPPRRAERRRFGLPRGSLYFFNRERPSDVEFDTPLASGAIRGTEFLLEVAPTNSALRLALIDGLVTLQTGADEVSLERGQVLDLVPGQPPRVTPLLSAVSPIQWALYYPAVLNPNDLALGPAEADALAEVLRLYRSGDSLSALSAWPEALPANSGATLSLRAALELSVGNVTGAQSRLAGLPSDDPPAAALRELIAVVTGETTVTNGAPRTSSQLLARTYTRQATLDLKGARDLARQAISLTPDFGIARARLAELEFSLGRRRAAIEELSEALRLSPRFAPAHAWRGFVLLDQGDAKKALAAFDQARTLDPALGPAWLGRGLCLLRSREYPEARAAFQAAAALEPQRALFRSYLGKAASELGDAPAAEKEFGLAKTLDPNDPTSWLYSALHLWQQNRINEAIADLEKSADLNDNRALFRSRLLLDADRSVRSANLAALYEDAGFPEVSRHAALRSVGEDYANFSGHLFLANSYQALEDEDRFDLRLETARQSELLVANLLAPSGAGNLSQVLSQQEHLRFFEPRPLGLTTFTEYRSNGDWLQAATAFGTVDGLNYALDASYESMNGDRPNNEAERHQLYLTLKQQVTPDDQAYFQIGRFSLDAGDLARYYDPAQAKNGFQVEETQEPTLYAGWRHTWSPGNHTLFLAGRLEDELSTQDPEPNVPFLLQSEGATSAIITPGLINLVYDSDVTLYSTELQHILEVGRHTLVVGGRWQTGDVEARARLERRLTGAITDQQTDSSFDRGAVYAYESWRILEPLRLVAGLSYDRVTFPENADLPPLTEGEVTRDQVSPKGGILLTPWNRGRLRAGYSQSLGGLYFDNSIRLEPTQVAGFNQAFRSLVPESVMGLVPGSRFESAGVGFDQSFPSGTWLGVEAEWLLSDGRRTIGVLTNSTILRIPDSPSSTRQNIDFRERNLSVYAAQSLGRWVALSARYRLSNARLQSEYPDIPDGAANLDIYEAEERATLQQLSLGANFNHSSGFFAGWESAWYLQNNSGYEPSLPDENFWQHNLLAGYRFPRRYAEIRLGLLNLLDQDYRLNPLNLYPNLPRGRTFVASLRLSF